MENYSRFTDTTLHDLNFIIFSVENRLHVDLSEKTA